jgi:hypothetical protein
MTASWPQQLEAWHDFYVIVGGAAAALTGLMFVVVSLGSQAMIARTAPGVRAFVTPTVVYFTTVLVMGGVMTIPSITAVILAGVMVLGSVGALMYLISIGGHQQWRHSKLDRLDWLWYVALPILSYFLILGAAVGIVVRPALGLEIVGGTMILLLVIGIRNAWDLVLWMTRQPRT